MSDWYLYMVRCRDGSLYTGISNDVARRFTQHQRRGDTGSKYLKGKGPLTLVFEKKVGSRSLALKLEIQVKKLPKVQKERLIEDSGYIEDLISQVGGAGRSPLI